MTPKQHLLSIAAAVLLPLGAQAADPPPPPPPPPMDLSGWVQLRSTDLYGPQWPKAHPDDEEGINPAYAAWHLSEFDPRPLLVKHEFDTVTLSWTHGDPPVTETYQAVRDVSMTVWVGDDGNLHATIHNVSETRPTVTDQTFIGMLVVPAGQSAEAWRNALTDDPLPLDITAYRAITVVPEPASAPLLAAGVCAALLWGRRRWPLAATVAR